MQMLWGARYQSMVQSGTLSRFCFLMQRLLAGRSALSAGALQFDTDDFLRQANQPV